MPDSKQSIILGAVVAALLSTSYLGFINCLCCAGMIIAGLLTVWHYTSNNSLTVPPGKGAVMGMTAVAIGSFIAIFLNFILIQMGIRADVAIMRAIVEIVGDNIPPDQLDQMQEQIETPATFGKHFLNGLIGVVVSAIFGAVGGAIGASVFKKGPKPGEEGTIV